MKINLQPNQKQALFESTERLNELGIRWSILRRHELLPDAIPGTQKKELDVDILVHQEDFDDAIDVAQKLGFEKQNNNRKVLLKKAAKNPKKAIEKTLKSPSKAIQRLGISFPGFGDKTPNEWASEGSYVYLMRRDELTLDFRNHLTHVSAWGSRKVRLNPQLEYNLLDHRRKRDGIYVPAPADELSHILGHVIFEYRGEITKYYKDRCDELLEQVVRNDDQKRIFKENLNLMFFEADSFVYEMITNGEYDSLRDNLLSYSDY